MADTAKKRAFEKKVVCEMIDMYAKANDFDQAQELKDYACMRIDKCPFMESKSFCSACKVHCYKKEKQEQIRMVMRWSGPRMLLHHPIMAIRHLWIDKKGALLKAFYLTVGFIGLAIGFLGAILPLLPSFPFLLIAAWGFSRGSERIHNWFLGTNLYKKNLKDWVEQRAMDKGAKTRVLGIISLVFMIGMYFTRNIPPVCIFILCLWIGHVYYFLFKLRTLERVEEAE